MNSILFLSSEADFTFDLVFSAPRVFCNVVPLSESNSNISTVWILNQRCLVPCNWPEYCQNQKLVMESSKGTYKL